MQKLAFCLHLSLFLVFISFCHAAFYIVPQSTSYSTYGKTLAGGLDDYQMRAPAGATATPGTCIQLTINTIYLVNGNDNFRLCDWVACTQYSSSASSPMTRTSSDSEFTVRLSLTPSSTISYLSFSWTTASCPVLSISNSFITALISPTARWNAYSTSPVWDLSYSAPQMPGTSTSHIVLDNAYYLFGFGGGVTQVQAPTLLSSTSAIMSYTISSKVLVTLTMSIALCPLTGRNDSILFSYQLKNIDTVSHSIGLRFMVDTELNYNDGAPFRVPFQGIVSTEVMYNATVSPYIPDYFYNFFSVSDSTHVSVATMRGSSLTTPDLLYFIDWSKAYNVGYYGLLPAVSPSTTMTDTAYIMYWSSKTVAAGQSITINTMFGLGTLTNTVAGNLIGTTSGPKAITMDGTYPNPFDISLSLQNTGATSITSISCSRTSTSMTSSATYSVQLPTTVSVGTLAGSSQSQASWSFLIANRGQSSVDTFTFTCTSSAATLTINHTIVFTVPLPTAPTNLALTSAVTTSSASLSWAATPVNPSVVSSPNGYILYLTQNGVTQLSPISLPLSPLNAIVPTLVAGSQYTASIAATNLMGTGPQSSSISFVTPVNISSISPTNGPQSGGTFVTLSGQGFAYVSSVVIGSATCSISSTSFSSLICQTTAAASSGSANIQVTVYGVVTTASFTFTYNGPITIDPTMGRPGTTVFLSSYSFQAGDLCQFGSSASTSSISLPGSGLPYCVVPSSVPSSGAITILFANSVPRYSTSSMVFTNLTTWAFSPIGGSVPTNSTLIVIAPSSYIYTAGDVCRFGATPATMMTTISYSAAYSSYVCRNPGFSSSQSGTYTTTLSIDYSSGNLKYPPLSYFVIGTATVSPSSGASGATTVIVQYPSLAAAAVSDLCMFGSFSSPVLTNSGIPSCLVPAGLTPNTNATFYIAWGVDSAKTSPSWFFVNPSPSLSPSIGTSSALATAIVLSNYNFTAGDVCRFGNVLGVNTNPVTVAVVSPLTYGCTIPAISGLSTATSTIIPVFIDYTSPSVTQKTPAASFTFLPAPSLSPSSGITGSLLTFTDATANFVTGDKIIFSPSASVRCTLSVLSSSVATCAVPSTITSPGSYIIQVLNTFSNAKYPAVSWDYNPAISISPSAGVANSRITLVGITSSNFAAGDNCRWVSSGLRTPVYSIGSNQYVCMVPSSFNASSSVAVDWASGSFKFAANLFTLRASPLLSPTLATASTLMQLSSPYTFTSGDYAVFNYSASSNATISSSGTFVLPSGFSASLAWYGISFQVYDMYGFPSWGSTSFILLGALSISPTRGCVPGTLLSISTPLMPSAISMATDVCRFGSAAGVNQVALQIVDAASSTYGCVVPSFVTPGASIISSVVTIEYASGNTKFPVYALSINNVVILSPSSGVAGTVITISGIDTQYLTGDVCRFGSVPGFNTAPLTVTTSVYTCIVPAMAPQNYTLRIDYQNNNPKFEGPVFVYNLPITISPTYATNGTKLVLSSSTYSYASSDYCVFDDAIYGGPVIVWPSAGSYACQVSNVSSSGTHSVAIYSIGTIRYSAVGFTYNPPLVATPSNGLADISIITLSGGIFSTSDACVWTSTSGTAMSSVQQQSSFYVCTIPNSVATGNASLAVQYQSPALNPRYSSTIVGINGKISISPSDGTIGTVLTLSSIMLPSSFVVGDNCRFGPLAGQMIAPISRSASNVFTCVVPSTLTTNSSVWVEWSTSLGKFLPASFTLNPSLASDVSAGVAGTIVSFATGYSFNASDLCLWNNSVTSVISLPGKCVVPSSLSVSTSMQTVPLQIVFGSSLTPRYPAISFVVHGPWTPSPSLAAAGASPITLVGYQSSTASNDICFFGWSSTGLSSSATILYLGGAMYSCAVPSSLSAGSYTMQIQYSNGNTKYSNYTSFVIPSSIAISPSSGTTGTILQWTLSGSTMTYNSSDVCRFSTASSGPTSPVQQFGSLYNCTVPSGIPTGVTWVHIEYGGANAGVPKSSNMPWTSLSPITVSPSFGIGPRIFNNVATTLTITGGGYTYTVGDVMRFSASGFSNTSSISSSGTVLVPFGLPNLTNISVSIEYMIPVNMPKHPSSSSTFRTTGQLDIYPYAGSANFNLTLSGAYTMEFYAAGDRCRFGSTPTINTSLVQYSSMDGTLYCTVPSSFTATSTVTVDSSTGNPKVLPTLFTYNNGTQPVITSVCPPVIPPLTSLAIVTLYGAGFASSIADMQVKYSINSSSVWTQCVTLSSSAIGELNCQTYPNISVGSVLSFRVRDIPTNRVATVYNTTTVSSSAPVVTAISPSSSNIGTQSSLSLSTSSYFSCSSAIVPIISTTGGYLCSSTQWISSTTVICTLSESFAAPSGSLSFSINSSPLWPSPFPNSTVYHQRLTQALNLTSPTAFLGTSASLTIAGGFSATGSTLSNLICSFNSGAFSSQLQLVVSVYSCALPAGIATPDLYSLSIVNTNGLIIMTSSTTFSALATLAPLNRTLLAPNSTLSLSSSPAWTPSSTDVCYFPSVALSTPILSFSSNGSVTCAVPSSASVLAGSTQVVYIRSANGIIQKTSSISFSINAILSVSPSSGFSQPISSIYSGTSVSLSLGTYSYTVGDRCRFVSAVNGQVSTTSISSVIGAAFCSVPSGMNPGNASIAVEYSDGLLKYAAVDFYLNPRIVITPTNGIGGTVIKVTCPNLPSLLNAAASQVCRFGSPASGPTSIMTLSLGDNYCTVPSTITSGNWSVSIESTGKLITGGVFFAVTSGLSLAPADGTIGTVVTVSTSTVANFPIVAGSDVCVFSSSLSSSAATSASTAETSVTVALSSTSATCLVPSGVSSSIVYVYIRTHTGNLKAYASALSLNGAITVSPSSGTSNTLVQLTNGYVYSAGDMCMFNTSNALLSSPIIMSASPSPFCYAPSTLITRNLFNTTILFGITYTDGNPRYPSRSWVINRNALVSPTQGTSDTIVTLSPSWYTSPSTSDICRWNSSSLSVSLTSSVVMTSGSLYQCSVPSNITSGALYSFSIDYGTPIVTPKHGPNLASTAWFTATSLVSFTPLDGPAGDSSFQITITGMNISSLPASTQCRFGPNKGVNTSPLIIISNSIAKCTIPSSLVSLNGSIASYSVNVDDASDNNPLYKSSSQQLFTVNPWVNFSPSSGVAGTRVYLTSPSYYYSTGDVCLFSPSQVIWTTNASATVQIDNGNYFCTVPSSISTAFNQLAIFRSDGFTPRFSSSVFTVLPAFQFSPINGIVSGTNITISVGYSPSESSSISVSSTWDILQFNSSSLNCSINPSTRSCLVPLSASSLVGVSIQLRIVYSDGNIKQGPVSTYFSPALSITPLNGTALTALTLQAVSNSAALSLVSSNGGDVCIFAAGSVKYSSALTNGASAGLLSCQVPREILSIASNSSRMTVNVSTAYSTNWNPKTLPVSWVLNPLLLGAPMSGIPTTSVSLGTTYQQLAGDACEWLDLSSSNLVGTASIINGSCIVPSLSVSNTTRPLALQMRIASAASGSIRYSFQRNWTLLGPLTVSPSNSISIGSTITINGITASEYNSNDECRFGPSPGISYSLLQFTGTAYFCTVPLDAIAYSYLQIDWGLPWRTTKYPAIPVTVISDLADAISLYPVWGTSNTSVSVSGPSELFQAGDMMTFSVPSLGINSINVPIIIGPNNTRTFSIPTLVQFNSLATSALSAQLTLVSSSLTVKHNPVPFTIVAAPILTPNPIYPNETLSLDLSSSSASSSSSSASSSGSALAPISNLACQLGPSAAGQLLPIFWASNSVFKCNMSSSSFTWPLNTTVSIVMTTNSAVTPLSPPANLSMTICSVTNATDFCNAHGSLVRCQCVCQTGYSSVTRCASCMTGYYRYPSCIPNRIPQGPPSPVSLASLSVSITGSNLSLAVSPPSDMGGLPLSAYVISITQASTGIPIYSSAAAPSSPLSISSLPVGMLVNVMVAAQNSLGVGAFSPPLSVLLARAPDTPLSLISTSNSGSSISLQWTPSFNGGSALTSYQLQVNGTSGVVVLLRTLPTDSTFFIVQDLPEASAFTVSIASQNALGTSQWSSPPLMARTAGFVRSVSPNSIPASSQFVVTITGTNMCTSFSYCIIRSVSLAGAQVSSILSSSPTTIIVVASAVSASGIGTGPVVVNAGPNWGISSSLSSAAFFTYNFDPVVVSSQPSVIGIDGSQAITIQGSNFVPSYTSHNSNAPGPVSLCTYSPVYSSSTATGLPPHPSALPLAFNSTASNGTLLSSTSIQCDVPPLPMSALLPLSANSNGWSLSLSVCVLFEFRSYCSPSPILTMASANTSSIDPSAASVIGSNKNQSSSLLTIQGSNFFASQAASTYNCSFSFSSSPKVIQTSASRLSDQNITCPIPPAPFWNTSQTASVSLLINNRTHIVPQQLLLQPPAIGGIYPPSVPATGNSTLTISGNGFYSDNGNYFCLFILTISSSNGSVTISSPAQRVNDTQLVCTTPSLTPIIDIPPNSGVAVTVDIVADTPSGQPLPARLMGDGSSSNNGNSGNSDNNNNGTSSFSISFFSCDANSTCSGNGICNPIGWPLCICSMYYFGDSCSVYIPPPPIPIIPIIPVPLPDYSGLIILAIAALFGYVALQAFIARLALVRAHNDGTNRYRKTAFWFWLLGGFGGAHRLYIGKLLLLTPCSSSSRLAVFCLYTFTFGGFTVLWILDILAMRSGAFYADLDVRVQLQRSDRDKSSAADNYEMDDLSSESSTPSFFNDGRKQMPHVPSLGVPAFGSGLDSATNGFKPSMMMHNNSKGAFLNGGFSSSSSSAFLGGESLLLGGGSRPTGLQNNFGPLSFLADPMQQSATKREFSGLVLGSNQVQAQAQAAGRSGRPSGAATPGASAALQHDSNANQNYAEDGNAAFFAANGLAAPRPKDPSLLRGLFNPRAAPGSPSSSPLLRSSSSNFMDGNGSNNSSPLMSPLSSPSLLAKAPSGRRLNAIKAALGGSDVSPHMNGRFFDSSFSSAEEGMMSFQAGQGQGLLPPLPPPPPPMLFLDEDTASANAAAAASTAAPKGLLSRVRKALGGSKSNASDDALQVARLQAAGQSSGVPSWPPQPSAASKQFEKLVVPAATSAASRAAAGPRKAVKKQGNSDFASLNSSRGVDGSDGLPSSFAAFLNGSADLPPLPAFPIFAAVPPPPALPPLPDFLESSGSPPQSHSLEDIEVEASGSGNVAPFSEHSSVSDDVDDQERREFMAAIDQMDDETLLKRFAARFGHLNDNPDLSSAAAAIAAGSGGCSSAYGNNGAALPSSYKRAGTSAAPMSAAHLRELLAKEVYMDKASSANLYRTRGTIPLGGSSSSAQNSPFALLNGAGKTGGSSMFSALKLGLLGQGLGRGRQQQKQTQQVIMNARGERMYVSLVPPNPSASSAEPPRPLRAPPPPFPR